MIEHKLPKGKPDLSFMTILNPAINNWAVCVEQEFIMKILVYTHEIDKDKGCLCDVYITGKKQGLKRKVFKYFSGWWKTENPYYSENNCYKYCDDQKDCLGRNFCRQRISSMLDDWNLISTYATASGVSITNATKKKLLDTYGVFNIDRNPFIGV